MADFDAFYLFRTTLFIAVSVFTVVTFAETVIGLGRLLGGAEPHRQMLRKYLAYQVLSVRLAPLKGELALLGLWSLILLLLWFLHRLL
jgi:hypothetical protein